MLLAQRLRPCAGRPTAPVAAQPVALSLSSGGASGGVLAFPASTFTASVTGGSATLTNCTNPSLLTSLSALASLTGMVSGTGLPYQALVSSVTPGSGSNGTVTLGRACPGSGTTNNVTISVGALPPTSLAASPYLVFPAASPRVVTTYPTFRLYVRNNSGITAVQPTLVLSDGVTLYQGNGGNLPLVEPGGFVQLPLSTWWGGQTSRGVLNMAVPGTPTGSMRLYLRNMQQGEALDSTSYAGFKVAAMAWST